VEKVTQNQRSDYRADNSSDNLKFIFGPLSTLPRLLHTLYTPASFITHTFVHPAPQSLGISPDFLVGLSVRFAAFLELLRVHSKSILSAGNCKYKIITPETGNA
jgi:hypothetical protein